MEIVLENTESLARLSISGAFANRLVEQAQRELAKGLHLLLRLEDSGPRDIDAIVYLLRQAPGNCPVMLTIRDAGKRDCVLRLGRDYHINPSKFPRDELENLLGIGNVKLT